MRAAWLAPAREVAGSLLAAADHPATGLQGVTPFRARLRAAEVLIEGGETAAGLAVIRHAVQVAGPELDPHSRVSAAAVLAAADKPDEAVELATAALEGGPGRGYDWLVDLRRRP